MCTKKAWREVPPRVLGRNMEKDVLLQLGFPEFLPVIQVVQVDGVRESGAIIGQTVG